MVRHTSLPSYVRTCKRSFEVSGRGAVAINLIPFSVYVVTIVESIVLFSIETFYYLQVTQCACLVDHYNSCTTIS